MAHIPQDLNPERGNVLSDWAANMFDHAAGFAQGALDLAAFGLVAGLLWASHPAPVAAENPLAPSALVSAACEVDCIATSVLTSGS